MSKPLRVLIVEDSEDDAVLLERCLKRGSYDLTFERVETADAMRNALEQKEWDIIIADYVLPQFSAPDALELLKKKDIDLPFIIVSGVIGEDTAVAAMKAGAHDFMTKGNLKRLIPAIERELREAEVRRERKRAVEDLREAEERFRTIVETAPSLLLITDTKGNNKYISPNCEEITGYTQEELKDNFKWWVHEDSISRAKELFDRTFQEGLEYRDFEYKAVKKNGDLWYASSSWKALKDKDGKFKGIVFQTIDITERKRTEESILIQRDLGQALGAASGLDETLRLCVEYAIRISGMDCGGVYLVDENTGSLDFAFHKGLSPDFVKSASHYDADSDSTRMVMAGKPIYKQHQELGITLDEVRRSEGLRAIAVIPISHEGQVIACLNIASHTFNEVPGYARTALETIANQIGNSIVNAKMEEELRFLSSITQQVTDSIIAIDNNFKIIYINKAAEEMYGYYFEELKGKTPDILNAEPTAAQIQEEIYRTINSGKIWIGSHLNKRKDGSTFICELQVFPLINREGRITSSVSVQRDITERLQAEKALKRKTEELARSNSDLEQFASIVSHDLQEPLRMVSGYCQLLSKRYKNKLDKDADEFIGYAVDGAKRMQSLINSLLMYSRLGRQDNPFESIDLMAILKQTITNLQKVIEKNNAVVTYDTLPIVMSNSSQLIQLFQNLIGNAIKFRSQDSPEIHISAQLRDNEWLFSVKDNSIGIDSQYVERIFMIFQRLNSRSEYPGSGIGLSICKRIVERHGGRIWLKSQPGKGSIFYFTIPMKEKHDYEYARI